MFSNIEEDYKKRSNEKKFNRWYFIFGGIVFVLFYALSYFTQLNLITKYIIIFLTLILLVLLYFYIDYKKLLKKLHISKNKNLRYKLLTWSDNVINGDTNNLVEILSKYNYKTKDEIKLAINYYSMKQPIRIESSYLAWIVSTALTVSSFIEIAYDKETNMINYDILGSKLGIIITVIIFLLVFKLIISMVFSKEKLYSQINNKLMDIYLNFDKYQDKLNNNKKLD